MTQNILFPLSNSSKISKKKKIISPLPHLAAEPMITGSGTGHEDLHSPFNLIRLAVPQQLSHLLPAALLVFWVPCKVVQDPGETTGRGVMA